MGVATYILNEKPGCAVNCIMKVFKATGKWFSLESKFSLAVYIYRVFLQVHILEWMVGRTCFEYREKVFQYQRRGMLRCMELATIASCSLIMIIYFTYAWLANYILCNIYSNYTSHQWFTSSADQLSRVMNFHSSWSLSISDSRHFEFE